MSEGIEEQLKRTMRATLDAMWEWTKTANPDELVRMLPEIARCEREYRTALREPSERVGETPSQRKPRLLLNPGTPF